jgi:hypothetical protein
MKNYKAVCTTTVYYKIQNVIRDQGRHYYESESFEEDERYETFVRLDEGKPDYGKEKFSFYLFHDGGSYPQIGITQHEKGFIAVIFDRGGSGFQQSHYAFEGKKFVVKNRTKYIDKNAEKSERIGEEEMAVEKMEVEQE